MDNIFEFEGNGLSISRKEVMRLMRFSAATVVVLILISVIFNTGIASAESGSINFPSDFSYSKRYGYGPYVLEYLNPTLETFGFYNAGYNSISEVRFNVTPLGYGCLIAPSSAESDVSTFDIVSGGTGYGVVSFSKSLCYLKYVFSASTIINSNEFSIHINKPTFRSNITLNNPVRTDYYALASDNPIYLKNNSGGRVFSAAAIGWMRADSVVSQSTYLDYTVTYPVSDYFQIDITKYALSADTKTIIHSADAIYQTETTFNDVSYEYFGEYLKGIYLNVTTQTGSYRDVLIRAYIPALGEYVPPSPSDKCREVPYEIVGNITQIDNTTFKYTGSVDSVEYPGYSIDATYEVNNVTGYRSNWSSETKWNKITMPNFTIETTFMFGAPDAVQVKYCAYNDSLPPPPVPTIDPYLPDLGTNASTITGVSGYIGNVSSGSVGSINIYTIDVNTRISSYNYSGHKNVLGMFIPSILGMLPAKIWTLIVFGLVLQFALLILKR